MLNTHILKSLTDPKNKRKIWITVAIIWSFIVLSWTFGQFGPSILELQIITNVSLQYASGFIIGHNAGYLCGSILSGILFDKVSGDKMFSLLISALGYAATLAIIPWCFIYETMVAAHVLKGIFGAGIDTCGHALLAHEWAHDGKILQFLMQVLHFISGLAATASPFAISPYLTDNRLSVDSILMNNSILSKVLPTVGPFYSSNSTKAMTSTASLGDTLPLISTDSVITNTATSQSAKTSLLYIPFSITSSLSLSSALFVFLLSILTKKKQETQMEKTSDEDNIKTLTNSARQSLILILLMVFFGIFIAIDDSFDAYLPSFCVRHMSWHPADASAATSLTSATFSFGRLVGILGTNVFKPWYQLLVHLIIVTVGYLCFLLSGFFQTDVGIWISIVITGFGSSVITPALYTLVDRQLFPLSGRIMSLLLTAATIGTLANPALMSYLMENISPIAFCYVLLQESFISLMIFIIIFRLSHKWNITRNLQEQVEINIQTAMNTTNRNGNVNPSFESTDL